ncbi:MAG: VOC family protein [Bacteroidota bacterium]
MAHINGIGGAFVFSPDPKRLADWYAEHLGIAFEGSAEAGAFYQRFVAVDPDEPSRLRDSTFAIMQAKTTFPPPIVEGEGETYGDQPFMVNLRTDDLDALVANLEAKGVALLDRQDESYGKFAWVRDPDGRRVELYQPVLPSDDAA